MAFLWREKIHNQGKPGWFIVVIVGLMLTFPAQGSFLEGLQEPSSAFDQIPEHSGRFLIPNEYFPQLAKPLWKKAPEGAYVSVGTDRGFIGFALTPEVTHLVLVDNDPLAVKFNQINITLLKLARSPEDFRHLRFHADYQEWVQRVQSVPEVQGLMATDRENFKFYRRQFALQAYPYLMENEEQPYRRRIFDGANYLFDSVLFARLRDAALNERIAARRLNLADREQIRSLIAILRAQNLPISVFDISNAWEEDYLGKNGFEDFINEVAEGLHEQGFVLITEYPRYFESSPEWLHWMYVAIKKDTLKSLRGRLSTSLLSRWMKPGLSAILNRKLKRLRRQRKSPLLDRQAIYLSELLEAPECGKMLTTDK